MPEELRIVVVDEGGGGRPAPGGRAPAAGAAPLRVPPGTARVPVPTPPPFRAPVTAGVPIPIPTPRPPRAPGVLIPIPPPRPPRVPVPFPVARPRVPVPPPFPTSRPPRVPILLPFPTVRPPSAPIPRAPIPVPLPSVRRPPVQRSPEEETARGLRAARLRANLLGEEERIRVAARAAQTARGLSGVSAVGGIAGGVAAGRISAAGATATGVGAAAIGGPIGIAVAAVAASLGVGAIAVRTFARAVETQTARLAGFSGPLAGAQAETEIRREMALFRRAQRIGPELAGAERLRSRFETAMTDLGTEILGILLKILDALEPAIETITEGVALISTFLEEHGLKIATAMEILIKSQLPLWVVILEAIQSLIERFFGEQEEKDEPEDEFAKAFMNLLLKPAGSPAASPRMNPFNTLAPFSVRPGV